MHVTIAKVDEVFFEGEAYSVTVPGSDGEMTLLSKHMPLITTIREGTVMIKKTSDEQSPLTIPVQGGVLEVGKNVLTILL